MTGTCDNSCIEDVRCMEGTNALWWVDNSEVKAEKVHL